MFRISFHEYTFLIGKKGIRMDNKAVGRRIRETRLSKGLTQEQLAELAGVSPTYISVIERGVKSPQLDTFVPLCNALGVSSDTLLVDVIDAAALAETNDISALLHDQPPEKQRCLIRMLKAAVSSQESW